jgi:hypothetical protein
MIDFKAMPNPEENNDGSGKPEQSSNSIFTPSPGQSAENNLFGNTEGEAFKSHNSLSQGPENNIPAENEGQKEDNDPGKTASSADSQNKKDLIQSEDSEDVLEESNPIESDNLEDLNERLRNTPYLPDEVFQKLPQFLRDCCNQFEDPRERDSFLTAAITVLSGCVRSICGTYDKRTVFPNLFCFIIASAANGKGSLALAKSLGMKIHNRLLGESDVKKENYAAELKRFREIIRQNPDSNETAPFKPEFKALFFPANTSSAALIDLLHKAGGSGIIFETEADTMANSLKQDWGGYSDFLRKSFQNEPVSYTRKTNSVYVEIPNPKISVVLSGTRTQVKGLIPSVEDGLFSRFIFYTFRATSQWRDVFPVDETNLTEYFSAQGDFVEKLADFLEQHPSKFILKRNQKDALNRKFEFLLKRTCIFISEETASVVKRLGLITFRISMILTAIRKFETGSVDPEITCSDDDFTVAMSLTEVYLEHALQIFSELPKTQEIGLRKNVSIFYDALPEDRWFQRDEAVKIGMPLGFQPRTVDKYLKEMDGFFLERKSGFGQYRKITK